MRLRENDLVWREIDGETVLLDLATSKYLVTNRTGTFVLGLLATQQDHDSLISALAERFEISTEVATADVDAFLATLRDRNLLAS